MSAIFFNFDCFIIIKLCIKNIQLLKEVYHLILFYILKNMFVLFTKYS